MARRGHLIARDTSRQRRNESLVGSNRLNHLVIVRKVPHVNDLVCGEEDGIRLGRMENTAADFVALVLIRLYELKRRRAPHANAILGGAGYEGAIGAPFKRIHVLLMSAAQLLHNTLLRHIVDIDAAIDRDRKKTTEMRLESDLPNATPKLIARIRHVRRQQSEQNTSLERRITSSGI